jgi:hypothetical protein
MSTMSPEDVRRLGAGMQAIAPKAERVVDKLPLNFLHAGLICNSLRRWLPYRDLLQPLLQGT